MQCIAIQIPTLNILAFLIALIIVVNGLAPLTFRRKRKFRRSS